MLEKGDFAKLTNFMFRHREMMRKGKLSPKFNYGFETAINLMRLEVAKIQDNKKSNIAGSHVKVEPLTEGDIADFKQFLKKQDAPEDVIKHFPESYHVIKFTYISDSPGYAGYLYYLYLVVWSSVNQFELFQRDGRTGRIHSVQQELMTDRL